MFNISKEWIKENDSRFYSKEVIERKKKEREDELRKYVVSVVGKNICEYKMNTSCINVHGDNKLSFYSLKTYDDSLSSDDELILRIMGEIVIADPIFSISSDKWEGHEEGDSGIHYRLVIDMNK